MAVDLDALREKYEDLKKKSKGGADWKTLEDGDNLVRFLSDEDGNFYHETGYHYVPQGKDRVAVVCNELDSQTECFLCGLVHELYKSKDKKDKELAKDLSAKPRIFFNVVDRADGKCKVLGTGNSIFKDLLKFFADPDWGDLTDPDTGHDVVINKTGQKLETEYAVMAKPKPSKLGVEPDFKDLSSIAEPFTNEEQEMVLNGVSTDDIFKAREKEGGGKEAKEEKSTKSSTKEASKPQPSRKPKQLTPEEQFADKIAQIDLDIPKANKLLKVWLEDDERTEDELDEIITKYPKDEESEPQDDASDKKEDEDGDDIDKEVAQALAKFKKAKSK